MRVRVNLVPAGARAMRPTSTSPHPPSRISEADYTLPPASPATCPGPFWGAWWLGCLFVHAREPEPYFRYPPLVARELYASLPWLEIGLSHKILWLRFSRGCFESLAAPSNQEGPLQAQTHTHIGPIGAATYLYPYVTLIGTPSPPGKNPPWVAINQQRVVTHGPRGTKLSQFQ